MTHELHEYFSIARGWDPRLSAPLGAREGIDWGRSASSAMCCSTVILKSRSPHNPRDICSAFIRQIYWKKLRFVRFLSFLLSVTLFAMMWKYIRIVLGSKTSTMLRSFDRLIELIEISLDILSRVLSQKLRYRKSLIDISNYKEITRWVYVYFGNSVFKNKIKLRIVSDNKWNKSENNFPRKTCKNKNYLNSISK